MDEHYMKLALQQAQQAAESDEVPVGAVIVHGERTIALAHNQREQLNDPTAHAEMIAITQAAEAIGDWRLEKCTLYVTLEPCLMCTGAIIHARLARVVYGAAEPKTGMVESRANLFAQPWYNHRVEVEGGLLAVQAKRLLKTFFADRR